MSTQFSVCSEAASWTPRLPLDEADVLGTPGHESAVALMSRCESEEHVGSGVIGGDPLSKVLKPIPVYSRK